LALAVLCRIINLIQNFWFGSSLYNSENFNICVIYVINSFVFLNYKFIVLGIFSENFDKVKNNLNYAEATQVLQYFSEATETRNYFIKVKNRPTMVLNSGLWTT